MRFPPGRKGKQVPVRIGVYGRGVGKWSLKQARDEWDRIRAWSRETGRNPRELKKEQQIQVQDSSGPTFAEACKSYLSHSSSKASKKEYPNLLNHQVIPRLGGDTPVAHLSWDLSFSDASAACLLRLSFSALISSSEVVVFDCAVLRALLSWIAPSSCVRLTAAASRAS